MRIFNDWYLRLGLLLLFLSLGLHVMHYAIFKDAHHIFIFLLEDLAFIPIHVLLVTLIIDRLLNERERQATYRKLNMVVGAFFHEFGDPLLTALSGFKAQADGVAKKLLVNEAWTDRQFQEVRQTILPYDFELNSRKGDLEALKNVLLERRNFLLQLLQHPNISEYQSFSDLVLAVFHLSDELFRRVSFVDLPEADYEHLSRDIKRVYGALICEWLRHMKHLKHDYPYLFSLAVRTNPFDPDASPYCKQ